MGGISFLTRPSTGSSCMAILGGGRGRSSIYLAGGGDVSTTCLASWEEGPEYPLPPLPVDRQTPVKTLPFPRTAYVVGNNTGT